MPGTVITTGQQLLAAQEPELVDEEYPTVYADGIARAWLDGPVVKIVLFRYAYRDGVRIRRPVFEIVRPASTLEGNIADLLKRYGGASH